MTTRLVVSGRLVAEVVVLVRVDDILLEVGPEPGEVVDLRGIAPDPLRILVHDGVVALVTISHTHRLIIIIILTHIRVIQYIIFNGGWARWGCVEWRQS